VSIALLHALTNQRLPVCVVKGEDVDALRVLVLAGHVKAVIPHPVRTLDGHDQPPATVTAITRLGRQMVERFSHRGRSAW